MYQTSHEQLAPVVVRNRFARKFTRPAVEVKPTWPVFSRRSDKYIELNEAEILE